MSGERHPLFNEEQRIEVCRLYGEGLSQREVADRVGLSRSRVRDILTEEQVPMRAVGRPPARAADAE